MPTKPLNNGERSVKSQADKRFMDTFFDDHKSRRFPNGRPWCGYREYAANPEMGDLPGFCTPLQKCDHEDPMNSAWDAPWVPEENGGRSSFYEFDYARKRIHIRYDRVRAHDLAAEQRYYQAAAEISGANGWGAIEYGKTPNYQVTAIIGNPPRSPKIAEAALAGDPWLLGFDAEPNAKLAALLGITATGTVQSQPTPKMTPEEVLAVPSDDELIRKIAAVVNSVLDVREKSKAKGKKVSEPEGAAA